MSFYHFYVNLFILSFIYKSYIPFTSFIFYFILNVVDLQVLCYIDKFLFYLWMIYQFSILMLTYLFYLLFTSLMLHWHNLFFVLHLMCCALIPLVMLQYHLCYGNIICCGLISLMGKCIINTHEICTKNKGHKNFTWIDNKTYVHGGKRK